MSVAVEESLPSRLARWKPVAQWGLLVAISLVIAALLEMVGIPAALLLGPLIAGVIVGTNGGTVRVPRVPYLAGQALIGCLIARVITADILHTFLSDWPLFLGVVFAIIAASSALGYLMSRWRILPGTTAVWGSSPGAASAMMLMAEAFGADARLVAFMQYLRVVFVAVAASLIARFWVTAPGGASAVVQQIVWFGPIDWLPFAETLLIAGVGAWLGMLLRIPAGALLVPMVIGIVLHVSGLVAIELPEWLLALSYALLGWNIGLGFTRSIIVHAARALPQIVLSTLALMTFCGGLAYLLSKTLGIDPLTAYLATSPGGMDSVAIISASTKVDVPFVMALQTVRFLVVLFIGPPLARLIAGRTGG